jgi:hypothetical protein
LWRRFSGTEMNRLYEEGFHIIFPGTSVCLQHAVPKIPRLYSKRFPGWCADHFEFSVRYYPNRDKLPQIHGFRPVLCWHKMVEPGSSPPA